MFSVRSLSSFIEEAAQGKHGNFTRGHPSDIFYQLSYLNLMRGEQHGNLYIASYAIHDGGVFYPFVRREIPLDDLITSEVFFDIITPYEYGGPFLSHANSVVMGKFLSLFHEYCKAENIVSEFIRMHPFLCKKEWLGNEYDVLENCQNIYVDLSETLSDIFSSFSSGTRRNIRVASRQGIKIERANIQDYEVFKEIYVDTMDRLGANQNYYFSDGFFSSLQSTEGGQFKIYNACKDNGDVLASVLFIGAGGILHYFLGGRLDLPRQEYAGNEYLFYEAIKDAIASGFKFLHLGGAGKRQEGLLRFKNGFSHHRIPYYTARRIHNHEVYNKLVNEKKTFTGRDADFFPAYR